MLEDIKIKVQEEDVNVMSSLKDFQRATVEKIESLFRAGKRRVLVADEVGLGKTMIAKGVISKTAKIRYIDEKDNLFKVIYVCSNLNIAKQNLSKLNLYEDQIGDISQTRLTMQHLVALEAEMKAVSENRILELVPLTPQTSFKISNSEGSSFERALMCAVLERIDELQPYRNELVELMRHGVIDASWPLLDFEKRVEKCHTYKSSYPDNIINDIIKSEAYQRLKEYLRIRWKIGNFNDRKNADYPYIRDLRPVFAKISVAELKPDLVIMDEFQRFKFLIDPKNDNEETILLAERFLNGREEDENQPIRVLLLSATPYKLLSTQEEIASSGHDEHFEEFQQVIKFLINNDEKFGIFKTVWEDYSTSIRELTSGDNAVIATVYNKKHKAEEELGNCMCRTERNSVVNESDFLDDSSKDKHLSIIEGDIRSYLQMRNFLDEYPKIGAQLSLDYVKSCPYIFSFMQKNYQAKKNIIDYFKHLSINYLPEKKDVDYLWLNKRTINQYLEVAPTNSRLEFLKDELFSKDKVGKDASLLMWVPPTKPYYTPQGVYKNAEGFSKILVFSCWEMVPRMLATMISYEAERRTVGKICREERVERKKAGKSIDNTRYFYSKRRYPAPRLTFDLKKDKETGKVATLSMALFTLIYPNSKLAALYDPVEFLNNDIFDLNIIQHNIREKVEVEFTKLKDCISENGYRTDATWYYLVPMLFEDNGRIALEWADAIVNNKNLDNMSGFERHCYELRNKLETYSHNKKITLGRKPDDLVEIVVNMVLASPAVCCLRAGIGSVDRAFEMANVFLRRFNTEEGTAIVELASRNRGNDDSHWKDVLTYCKNGNFQAMIDEYFHLKLEGKTEFSKETYEKMIDAISIHTAAMPVESYEDFRRVAHEKFTPSQMRASFAVNFSKTQSDSKNSAINRKTSVQEAFNCPLRPFVLATTSIGQEGLDFHLYCRKIMHWNLPSNAIDLEQREGRINRFKCLAVRSNVAKYCNNIVYSSEKKIWDDLFAAAANDKPEGKSDLIPYWYYQKGNDDTKIERLLPLYPMSRDENEYNRLIRILSYYRIALGQPRQEEVLETLFKNVKEVDKLKGLFLDLSPFNKKKHNN